MGTQITIEVTSGNRFVRTDDLERAETAALRSLAAAGVTVERAFAAYKEQWARYDDEDPMTGDKAIRVTGHVEHLHRWMSGGESFREYAPVYSRHHYVREEQMNRAGVLSGCCCQSFFNSSSFILAPFIPK